MGLTPSVCRSLTTKPHVWWLDNYAKFYHIRVPSEERAYLRQCRWTVCGVRPLPMDSLTKIYAPDGGLVSAMPTDLYESVPALLSKLRAIARKPSSYIRCLTSLHKLYTFPPGRPQASRRCPRSEEFWAGSGDVSAATFVPTALDADDVGSNAGLVTVFLRWWSARKETTNYGFVVADVNIFDRIMKENTITHLMHLCVLCS